MQYLSTLTFREAVWLFPLATLAHFLEEGRRFPSWAREHISPRYTRSHWTRVHSIGLAYAAAFSALVSAVPSRSLVFLYIAVCLAPSVFNTLFHVGATAFYRSYSPGLITALVVYPPLFLCLGELSFREGLLTPLNGLIAAVLAGGVHTLDIATSVFFVTIPRGRRTEGYPSAGGSG